MRLPRWTWAGSTKLTFVVPSFPFAHLLALAPSPPAHYFVPRHVTQESINQLIKRFPNSPRSFVLEGMLLEARGLEAEAKAFYEKMLVLDETSIVSSSNTSPFACFKS